MTRSDADVLCSFHDAAWVAEIDYPGNLMCSDLLYKDVKATFCSFTRPELLAES